MQLNAALTVIIALFTLGGLAGGVLAYLRTNLTKSQIEILQGTNKAQSDRIEFISAENDRLKLQVQQLEKSVEILEKVVTGKELLENIFSKLKEHDKGVIDRDKKIFNDLEELLDGIGAINTNLDTIRVKVGMRRNDRQ